MTRWSVALLVAAGPVLAGCGGAAPAAPAPRPVTVRLVGAADYSRLVEARFGRYDWPPGLRPDLDRLLAQSRPPAHVLVPEGNARVVLDVVNTCAWYLDLARSGPGPGRERALAAVRGPVAGHFAGDPPGAELNRRVVAAAEAGDIGPARSYARVNCDTVRWG